MNNFTKVFIRTSTRYAEYVEAKILERIGPQELGPGQVIDLEPPEFEEELRKEMQTMIKTAELLVAARSQKEQENTPKTGEGLKGLVRCRMEYNEDTDVLKIIPGSGDSVQLCGAEDAKNFIEMIQKYINESMRKIWKKKNREDGRSVP